MTGQHCRGRPACLPWVGRTHRFAPTMKQATIQLRGLLCRLLWLDIRIVLLPKTAAAITGAGLDSSNVTPGEFPFAGSDVEEYSNRTPTQHENQHCCSCCRAYSCYGWQRGNYDRCCSTTRHATAGGACPVFASSYRRARQTGILSAVVLEQNYMIILPQRHREHRDLSQGCSLCLCGT